jgi:hypothetical protein
MGVGRRPARIRPARSSSSCRGHAEAGRSNTVVIVPAGRSRAGAAPVASTVRARAENNPGRIAMRFGGEPRARRRAGEARQAMGRMHALDPSVRVSNLEDELPIHRPDGPARFADGLRLAGCPSEAARVSLPSGRSGSPPPARHRTDVSGRAPSVPPGTRSRDLARRHRIPLLPLRGNVAESSGSNPSSSGVRITADRPAALVCPETGDSVAPARGECGSAR